MATNIRQGDSDTLQYTNLLGVALASGRAVAIGSNVGGSVVGILKDDLGVGLTGPAFVRGVVRYTKLAGAANVWAVGDAIFYDTANDRMSKVATADTVYAGVAFAAAANADVIGFVNLNIPSRAVPVADAAGANPTQAEYGALLTALRNAGIIDFA